ncbi:helix-turn-helix domain-containing protein [Thalassococcus sp. CAU 1522]|uniref:Helix-turn-helix domain-containing protein n=1 Tax=Thalassococcus arenae TaxID=2851652 RepID=A0ABS6N2T7_9RHOB|nr:SRPBCC domain-containing protein [Thalassococcus arenae]MBV2358328.1 helix-turn-helix domain-containing protein [Thalassococcus arenae]
MDSIFKALNDPARRALLDSLRKKDGQTLTELEDQLDMTRFGVMKHLRVLEDAHLVVPKKVGRFKHHYLNALPLQEVIDRWIDPFLKPQAQALTALKTALEKPVTKPDFMMSTFINCTHDALWDALTRGELISQYHFACSRVTGDYAKPGDVVDFHFDHGGLMLSNKVIAIEPKTRIEMAFEPHWGGDETASRCVYLLEPTASGMKLTVEHYDFSAAQTGIGEGWARYLSGLKTYLETGTAHRFFPEMAQ